MPFTQLVTPTLRELFLREVLKSIFSGELRPGDKLPTERELAESMGLSRSMVHLGLEDLERMGFVTVVPRKGNYVADFRENGNFETLGAIAKYSGRNPDEKMTTSMVEIRNAVVGGSMKRLAKTQNAEAFSELRSIVAQMQAAINGGERDSGVFAGMMRDFEIRITALCGNYFFPMLINSFAESGEIIWQRCCEFWGPEKIAADELRLIELMEAGRGDAAQKLIEDKFEKVFKAKNFSR